MKLPDVKTAALVVLEGFKKKSPDILIGAGVVGLWFAGVTAVEATPKALERIEARKDELDTDKLSVKETIKTAGPCYIKSLALAVTSTGCIVLGDRKHIKRNAALTAAYSMSEKLAKEYQDKTLEIVGEKKEKEIRDAVAQERIDREPVSNREVLVTGRGDQLCYDMASGRYFKGDREFLRRIENDLNGRMLHEFEPYVSLNDLYDLIGLPVTTTGDDLGWNTDQAPITFIFSSTLAEDGRPCLTLDFNVRPRYDFRALL